MAAIVAVESRGNPFALNDNTTHRSYSPRDHSDAISTARALIAQGHSVDVGIAQVNSTNFAAFHTTEREMLDPCRNLYIASSILADAYARSSVIFSDPQPALWHAISAYNTGSLYAGKRYVSLVVAAASRAPLVPTVDLLRHEAAPESSSTAVHTAPKRVQGISVAPIADFSVGAPNAQGLLIKIPGQKYATNGRAR
jgi:soluble lytic murein transglycosylase-like protein